MPDGLENAEGWLQQNIAEAEAQLYPKDTDEVAVGNVTKRLQEHSSEFQRKAREVLGRWLLSDNDDKADWALMLIIRLRATEHISALEQLRKDVKSGRSSFSHDKFDREYYLDVLPRVIVSLMKERGDNWWSLAKSWLRLRLLPATEEALNRLAQR